MTNAFQWPDVVNWIWDPLQKKFVGANEKDEEYDEDQFTRADELSTQLWIIGRKEAADYVDTAAKNLDSYCDHYSLLRIFDWHETAQGYGYWEEIFHELLSYMWEDINDPYLEGIEL